MNYIIRGGIGRYSPDDNFELEFAFRLKAARIAKNISRREIAEQLGISEHSYAAYERGHREPRIATIKRIVDILEIDGGYLFK